MTDEQVAYKFEDLVWQFKDKTIYECDQMIAHLLLAEVLWTREAYCTYNRGGQYEGSDEGTAVYMNCNDVFMWACADSEALPHSEVPALFLLWHEDKKWGSTKWICMRRNMQPQGPIKRDMKADGSWNDKMEALPENAYQIYLEAQAAKRKEATP